MNRTSLPAFDDRSRIGHLVRQILLVLATMVMLVPSVEARRTIRMVVVDSNYRVAFEAVANEYMRRNPDVEVRIQIVAPSGYPTWLRTALAGGQDTAPDIYNFNFGSGFFETGKAINLQPHLDSISPYTGEIWRDSFFSEYLEMMTFGEDIPQVPLNYVEIGIFYNRDLFEKVGVEVPTTWEELLEACEKIARAGYIPLAMPGDKESYWGGVVGWVIRLFTDAWFYDVVPAVMAQPGDFYFDPDTDADFEVDFDDPFNDLLVSVTTERRLMAILDGELAFDGPRMREVYTFLRDFSRHWQRGFHGSDAMSVYNLFLTQRAAMMFNASPAVLVLERDIARLQEARRFEWGAFHPPRVTSSEIVRTPFRGVGAPLPVYGIIRKSREQNAAAVDFLMFLTSPEMCRLILDETIRAEEAIVGPFSIRDVPLDPEMDEKFRPFLGHGREKLEIRGLEDDQESVWRWSTIAQDYMAGRISLDEFLERYQRLMIQTIPNVVRRFDLDMDPTTRDNNGALVSEVLGILGELATSGSGVTTTEGLVDHVESILGGELARRVTRPEDSPFDLLIERTIPVLVTSDESEYRRIASDARRTAEENGAQYLVLIHVGGDGRVRHEHFNFRPTHEEVLARMSGRRYTSEELRRIWR